MLTSSGIAVDNLYYSNYLKLPLNTIKTQTKIISYEPNPIINGTTNFVDTRFKIHTVDKSNRIISTYIPEYGIWTAGRQTFGMYNPIDNKYYVIVRLKSDHPQNISSSDNEPWLIAIDLDSYETEFIKNLESNYFVSYYIFIYALNSDSVIVGIRGNQYGQFLNVDLNTGAVVILDSSNSSLSNVGSLINTIGNVVYCFSKTDVANILEIAIFDLFNQSRSVLQFNFNNHINPLWLLSPSRIIISNIVIKGKVLFFAVAHKSLTTANEYIPEPHNFDILKYNIESGEFIERIIGGGVELNDHYLEISMDENFNVYCQRRYIGWMEFYAPRPVLGNALLRTNNKVLQT